MKIRPFIKPLYELLDSNDYVVRYYSYYYLIGKTPIQTSVYIQHILTYTITLTLYYFILLYILLLLIS